MVKNWEEKLEVLACASVRSLVDRGARMIAGERQGHCAGCDWKWTLLCDKVKRPES